MNAPLIELKHVTVSYGNLTAVKGIDFSMKAGEIRVLTGEHGAGKTTLAKILGGILGVQRGEVLINGKEASPRRFAREHFEYVPKEGNLINQFSIAKNFMLFQSNRFIYNHEQQNACIERFFEQWGIDLNPKTLAGNLYQSDRVLVSILERIYRNPKFLVVDEALDSLSLNSFKKVLRIIKTLNTQGTACLLISHDLENTRDIAESVTIMKHGEVLATEKIIDIDTLNIIKLTYANYRSFDTSEQARDFYQLLKYNEAILEILPVNIIVLDKSNAVKLINNAASNFFSIEGDTILGRSFEILFSDEDRKLTETIKSYLLKQAKANLLDRVVHIKGTIHTLNITFCPIREENTLIGQMVLFFDTTETSQLREKISFMDKMSSINILTAGVAHEINNPLGIINNCLDYLSNSITDQEQRDVINEVEEEIVSISRIISSLVSYSSQNVTDPIRFDLGKTIEGVYVFFKYYGKEKGVKVVLAEMPEKLFCYAKVTDIKQILLNILKNAVEEMPHGGNVVISVGSTMDGGKAKINIQDDGNGLNIPNVNDVFLPFYSTKSGNNVGLGLYISYNLAQQNNGTITVENIKPHGCLFSVEIPLYKGSDIV